MIEPIPPEYPAACEGGFIHDIAKSFYFNSPPYTLQGVEAPQKRKIDPYHTPYKDLTNPSQGGRRKQVSLGYRSPYRQHGEMLKPEILLFSENNCTFRHTFLFKLINRFLP